MKGKGIITGLLAGILALPMPYTGADAVIWGEEGSYAQEYAAAYWVTGFNGNISSEVSLQAQEEEKTVSCIAEEVFKKCSRLKKMHIPGTIKEIGA